MIEVEGPDGAVIEFPDGTPQETIKAVLSKHYAGQPSDQELLDNLGGFGAPAQGGGNTDLRTAASNFLGGVASDQSVPGLAGGAVRAAGGIGKALVDDPVQFFVDGLSGPSRIVPNLGEATQDVVSGRPGAALGNLAEAATAAAETGLIFAAPGAASARGAAARQAATRPVADKATTTALKSIQEADPNILQTANRAKTLQAADIPVTPADLTTRNLQSRLKGAARRDGPAQDLAQDAFDPRQADQVGRLTETIQKAFNVTDDFLTKTRSIAETKQAAAAPLYAEAHATPTKLTPRLVELVHRPPLRAALRQADELAAIDGVRLNKLPSNELPAVQVGSRLEGDTARLHFMRRALDDQIDTFRDKTTGKLSNSPRAQALVRLRRQFNDAIREANPAFAKADAVWSEGTAAEQAMERGLKAASFRTERQVRQHMADAIKAGDQEFFELGFAQGLVERVGGSGSELANRTLQLRSPENQKIIRAVLGDQRGNDFIERIEIENLMSRVRSKISPNVGSDTAENLQQTASQALSVVADVLSTNPARAGIGALRAAGQKKLSARLLKEQQAVDEKIIRLATEDPDRLIQLITDFNRNASRPASERILDYAIPAVSEVAAIGATGAAETEAKRLRLPSPQ